MDMGPVLADSDLGKGTAPGPSIVRSGSEEDDGPLSNPVPGDSGLLFPSGASMSIIELRKSVASLAATLNWRQISLASNLAITLIFPHDSEICIIGTGAGI